MKIREAILKAADSIEQNPKLFNFGSCYAPNTDCGTPGCALGWIGLHAGMAINTRGDRIGKFVGSLDGVANLTIGDKDAFTFYFRMSKLESLWKSSASMCAKTLRFYADKYHPVDNIPSSVRAIFEVETIDA